MVRHFQKPSPFHRWEKMTITIPLPQKLDHRSSLDWTDGKTSPVNRQANQTGLVFEVFNILNNHKSGEKEIKRCIPKQDRCLFLSLI